MLLAVAAVAVLGLGAYGGMKMLSKPHPPASEMSSQSRRYPSLRYVPTEAEWANLTVETAGERAFRTERVTEGKVAVDEDRATPIFSPYAGRVTRLLARPGDQVRQGQPLYAIEAADSVQAQNDFITAVAGFNKARSQVELARIQDRRAQDLFAGKAVPLKEVQTAQAALVSAQSDLRSAEIALEATRNRLRILGLSDESIATFQETGRINPETVIPSPISGTVVQRKIGPGQYVSAGASDPVFVIGDLSTVWLTAFVRESEAAGVAVGQEMSFTVLAYPGRTFSGSVNYVSTSLDPASRRLMVRATLDNKEQLLKPEMFANVTIYSGGDQPAVAVPKQALIYEADQVRVWVVLPDKSIEARKIRIGAPSGDLIAVTGNLSPGEKIITKGSLFIDRTASGS